jgi:hypothetical protein
MCVGTHVDTYRYVHIGMRIHSVYMCVDMCMERFIDSNASGATFRDFMQTYKGMCRHVKCQSDMCKEA